MAPILTRVGQSFGFGASAGGSGPPGVGYGGHEATGGYKSDYTDPSGQKWRAHVFISNGNFNLTALSTAYPATAEVMMVAGGGGGGSLDAGGGGGGAVLYRQGPNIPVDVSNARPVGNVGLIVQDTNSPDPVRVGEIGRSLLAVLLINVRSFGRYSIVGT